MSICKKCKKKNFCVTYAYLLSRSIGLPNECGDFIGEQTNEEWFCGLALAEKSDWIADFCKFIIESTENGNDVHWATTKTYWDVWLKAVHTE